MNAREEALARQAKRAKLSETITRLGGDAYDLTEQIKGLKSQRKQIRREMIKRSKELERMPLTMADTEAILNP